MNARTTCRPRHAEPRWLVALLLAAAAVAVATSACSTASEDATSPSASFAPASGPLVLEIDLVDDRTWAASGPLVESGAICPRAIRHHLEWFDPETGEPIDAIERRQRVDDAWSGRREADIIDVWENTCHDGSGSIITEEARARRSWTVRSGTGAYLEVSGSGTLSVQRDWHGTAESLYIVAEVQV